MYKLSIILYISCCLQGVYAQCNFTVNAGPDQKVCNPGEMVTLNGKITGSVQEIFWEPPTGLSNPKSPVTKATVNATTEYILTGRGLSSINLITNGNFEAGNTGFTTDYMVGTTSCYGFGYLDCEGTYAVINNPQLGHAGFAPCGDHTSGSGLMMVLNGSANLQNVWCQTINVMPDMDYIFSAWVTAVVSSSPPILQFSINGVNIGNIFNSSGATCSWEQFQTTWNSGANTTAEICIVNLNTATGGNDFAVDDISFRKICEIKDTVLVEVEEINVVIENPEIVTCDDPRWKLDASGSSSGPGWKYQWTTSDGKIVSGGNTLTPTIEGPGTYYLTICSPLPNCCKTEFVVVTGNIKPPDLQLSVKDTLGCNNQAVSIFSKSRVSPLNYEWAGPNGFNGIDPFVVVTEGGRYYLTVTDEFNCKAVDSVDVIERTDNPKISIQSNNINCQADSAKVLATSTVPGSNFEWSGPNQFFVKSDRFQTVDSGWFFLRVVTPSGCIKLDSVLLKKDIGKPRFQFSMDTITCLNDSSRIIVIADRPLDTVFWSGTHPFRNIDSFSISTKDAGKFSFVGIGLNNCQDTLSITVPIDTLKPSIQPAADSLNCRRTQSLLVSGKLNQDVAIDWSGPNGFHSNMDSITTFVPGSYVLTATTRNGCSSQSVLNIHQDTLHPLLSITDDTLNCNKRSTVLNLHDTARSTYLWNGPNGFSSIDKNPAVDQAGIYSVEATSTNGCKSLATIIITADTIRPILELFSDTLTCKKDSLFLRVNVDDPQASLQWQGPMGFQSILKNPFVQQSGIYTLTATKANGCQSTASLTIYRDVRKPEIYLRDDTLNCLTRNVAIIGKTNRDSLTYRWSGPGGFQSTDSTIQVNQGGIYTLQVESPEGCITESQMTVVEDTLKPNLQLPTDTLNCLITKTVLQLQSNLPLESIYWSGPGNFTSALQQPEINNGGLYNVTVTGINHCSNSISVNIVQDTAHPNAIIQTDSIDCTHRQATLVGIPNNKALQGIWTRPDGSMENGNVLITNMGGRFTFQLTGANHCTSNYSSTVKVDTLPPDVVLTNDTIRCNHLMAHLAAISQNPLNTAFWNGPGTFTSNSLNVTTTLPGKYHVTMTGKNGCTTADSLSVAIDTLHPNVSTRSDSIHCRNTQATLIATIDPVADSYYWTDANGTILGTQASVKVSKGGVYSFIASNSKNGCSTTAKQFVLEDSLIIRDVEMKPKHPTCGALEGTMNVINVLGGHQGIRFAIDDPNLWTSSPQFNAVPIGHHILFVSDSAGCTFQKGFEILDIPTIQIQLPPQIEIQLGKSGTLNLDILSNKQMIKSIQWSPDTQLSCTQCEDPEANPWVNTEYTVTVVDTNDCLSVLRILVKVETPNVWAPNVFSPNGDQINDWFYLIASEPDAVQINVLSIYDRWGNQVFQSTTHHPNQALHGWNGQWKGEKCMPGVYTYWAEVELINGDKRIVKGDLTLIR